MKDKISKKFESLFGGNGILFVAPGRFNLIGEHTDYNGGFVFPGAIDKFIMAEIRPNGTERVRVSPLILMKKLNSALTKKMLPNSSGHAIYSVYAVR